LEGYTFTANKDFEVAKEITNDKYTEFEKIKTIHDWVVLNTEYSEKSGVKQSHSGIGY